MGDRVSIAFKDGAEESVVLFNHWGGREFMKEARQYIRDLRQEIAADKKKGGHMESGPLGRLEPNTVMVDFVRHITKDKNRVESSLYFGATENDGDNSDNGHFKINVHTGDDE